MNKYRNVAVIVYAEDITKDELVKRVSNLHVPAFISPLHDLEKDYDESEDSKKSHYHVMLMYDSPRIDKKIEEDLLTFSNGRYKPLISARGYARYLIHLDDKDKTQYSPGDVMEFGGAVYKDYLTTDMDKAEDVCSIIDYIEEMDINTFRDLVIALRQDHKPWLYSIYEKGAYFFKEYLHDRRDWRFKKN